MEMNFTFNEKHKKAQFWLTSSKWSIVARYILGKVAKLVAFASV